MFPTSAKVVWTPLVAGGEPRQTDSIKGCNHPFNLWSKLLAAVMDDPLQLVN